MPAPYDPVPVFNDSGEDIPAHAVVEPTGVVMSGAFFVRKPTADGARGVLVNGPAVVPAGQFGQAYAHPRVVVRVDDGAPAVGEEWGAQAGSWALGAGGGGFVVTSEPADGRVNALRFGASGGGGGTGGSTGCNSLRALKTTDCVLFNATGVAGDEFLGVPAGGRWVGAETVETGVGTASIALMEDEYDRQMIRVQSGAHVWYLHPTGESNATGCKFVGRYTPKTGEEGSGGTACDGTLLTVYARCTACEIVVTCGEDTFTLPPVICCRVLYLGDYYPVLLTYRAPRPIGTCYAYDGEAAGAEHWWGGTVEYGGSVFQIVLVRVPETDAPCFNIIQCHINPPLLGYANCDCTSVEADLSPDPAAALPWDDGTYFLSDPETGDCTEDGSGSGGAECCSIATGTTCTFVVTGGSSAGTYTATWAGGATGSVTFYPIPSDDGLIASATVFCNGSVYAANGQAQDGSPDCGPPVTATWTGASLAAIGLGAGATSAVFTA